ncbi:MFS transporter [Sphingosinicella ginsenosidimutans]|uniref:MHS family MFS transporter n=1 Tax=Allosphingosinicella ginsenosidimutans TaxID=1176539 RepID=A0A5C6TUX5_9SPHN|nr:MFS transporter [Sphingosinicella ginsenosidimutans]TXC63920.1 MHS family MFS transporter [Sphingosinicella ginsenosidimutans]
MATVAADIGPAGGGPASEPSDLKRDRLVIFASSLGTVFEWYDFFVYGTLAATLARLFFPASNPMTSFLLVLASFGVGFGMRPLGAILFGYLGDRLGRKYTFLITITLMGVATAGVGLMPTYAQIGAAAPILLVILRIMQGLALGGEYGGAAIYVAEHAPANRRGLYTSFIQAGVIGGFMLSLAVVLGTNALLSAEAEESWGWRVPFLISLLLLAVSLWVRLKLKESPVFQAIKEAGELARNPLRESFRGWRQIRMIFVSLFGIAAGLTVVWYTATFQALYFLQNSLRIDDTAARLIIGLATVIGTFWFILFGWLSDRIGRKPPIIAGYALTIILLFPLFHWMAAAANPELSAARLRSPVTVQGTHCEFNPFASRQANPCGRALDALTRRGISYEIVPAPGWTGDGDAYQVRIGAEPVDAADEAALDRALGAAGYRLEKTTPPAGRIVPLVIALLLVSLLSGMTYGPVAALLVELFPARVRYTSLSIPYHVGTGYFGGFLPFISQYIVARTGDPFAGLWYTVGVVAAALVITLLWLPETAGRRLD